jgi:TRAP-type C4-dicarboxylate transport system permease small subunit
MMTPSNSTVERKAGSSALRFADGIGRVIDTVAVTIAVGSVVVIFLALMADVVFRYFTSSSLGWPSEVPNLLFPWLVMGGIVVGAQRGSHIAAEAIRAFISDEQLRFLLAFIDLIVAASFVFLAYLSLQVIAITKTQVFPMTGLGQAWAYSALLFGFGGIALSSLVNFVRVLCCDDPRNVHNTDPEHIT